MTLTQPRLADADVRSTPRCNRLLAALPKADFELIEPYLKEVTLTKGQMLFDAGEDVTCTYFPCHGTVTGIMIISEDGRQVEAAVIGREGAIGGVISQGHKPAFGCGVVQIGGKAMKISSDRLDAAKENSEAMADLFTRYGDFLLAQVMQFASCNALHSVEERLARTLIMTQDRVGAPVVDVTQQGLADALGVQRTSVTTAARALETAGLIQNRRGKIEVVSRAGLEAAACGCYAAIEEHFDQLLPTVAL